MRFPPRGTPLLRGTFVLPDPVEEEGRLVYREPLGDTLVPLCTLAATDLALCTLVAFLGEGFWRFLCLAGAAVLSFLVAALAFSLLRRPEVVLDRAAGRVRVRRPEKAPLDLPMEEVRAVTLEPVKGGGEEAPAAGLEITDGGWLPLHVGWSNRRGGGESLVRSRGGELAAYLGVPLVERALPAPAPQAAPAPVPAP